MFRFWAKPKIETHLPCFTSEASYKNEIRTICYTLLFAASEANAQSCLPFEPNNRYKVKTIYMYFFNLYN
ncbi:MAG: hypothetical protein U5L45_02940 [Saprospiraceae bacterium]|nr:hypothetical protein [Saprospiraceae bacterium]